MDRAGGLVLFFVAWAVWALAVNALVQKIYPTRANADATRAFLYSLIVKASMIAPLIGFAIYMNSSPQ